jgi:hypothetical protein
VFFLLVSLLLSAWTPIGDQVSDFSASAAADAGPKLTIDNKTGANVTVSLSGPRSYTLTATPGKSIHAVDPGKYKYSYQACGAAKKGTLTVQAKAAKLPIAKCVMAGVTIQNDTGSNIYLTLSGTASYSFTLAPGKTKISVIKGKYVYRVSGACGATNGTTNLKKGDVWRWWCTG